MNLLYSLIKKLVQSIQQHKTLNVTMSDTPTFIVLI